MSRIFSKKRALLTAAIASLALVAVAIAYWTTTGEGTGSGDVAATNGTVELKGTIDNELAPGQNSDVTIVAWNDGDTDLYVTSTTLSNIAAAGDCVDSDFSDTAAPAGQTGTVAEGTVIPASSSEASPVTLNDHNIAFANDPVNSQDDCKSTTISFDLDSD
jgi:hypothetical protein